MGGTQQLARLAGGVAGLGIAFAAAAPFSGVPPQGVSGAPAPAQVEVRTLASPELSVDPIGVALKATAFPEPGERGGPALAVKLTNITPVTLRLSLRLTGLSPMLSEEATVRGSAAGAVLVDGPLTGLDDWTTPAGVLAAGETTTLRLRFKLMPGLRPDAYRGRLDVRQLEVQGQPLVPPATAPEAPQPGAPTQSGTAGTTPAGNASVTVLPAETTPGTTTPPTTPEATP